MISDAFIIIGIIFFLAFLFVVFPYGALLMMSDNIRKIRERLDAIEEWIYEDED